MSRARSAVALFVAAALGASAAGAADQRLAIAASTAAIPIKPSRVERRHRSPSRTTRPRESTDRPSAAFWASLPPHPGP